MTGPRAADDFPMIRSRMEELRRERAPAVDHERDQTPSGPRLNYHRRNGETERERERLLPRSVVRFIR